MSVAGHCSGDRQQALAGAPGAPVWGHPWPSACPPPDHRLYAGELPFAIAPLARQLEGHDLVLLIGAPMFHYYTYARGSFAPGAYLPDGTRLVHISDDPAETARASIGDSLVGDFVPSGCGVSP